MYMTWVGRAWFGLVLVRNDQKLISRHKGCQLLVIEPVQPRSTSILKVRFFGHPVVMNLNWYSRLWCKGLDCIHWLERRRWWWRWIRWWMEGSWPSSIPCCWLGKEVWWWQARWRGAGGISTKGNSSAGRDHGTTRWRGGWGHRCNQGGRLQIITILIWGWPKRNRRPERHDLF